MTHPSLFAHGYALLIGVDDNQESALRLPDVAKDVKALAQVLTHPERCAYPQENVRVIQGSAATRAGILDGLNWLHQRITANENATAVIYYSGHGYRETEVEPPSYYLVPYDVSAQQIALSALPAIQFAQAIRNLKPKRLLVVLDCCHAGGMDVKALEATLPDPVALPVKLFVSGAAKGAGVEQLGEGHGRAALSSSQGSERSYMRPDGEMSLFTYHLVEALTGHAQPAGGASEVLVSDVLSYVHRQVPKSAQAIKREQNPEFELRGNFPIALVLGGKGLAKGASAPSPLDALPPAQQATNTGSGALAQGEGAVAAGQRGVAIGGDVSDSQIITGDRNRINRIDTGGGAYIGGGVTTSGGDFVGRDKVVHGYQVRGDKIRVGNVTGSSGVAIGRGASAVVNQGVQGGDLAVLFAAIYRQIETRADDPAVDREEIRQTVERVEQEVGKGEAANPEKVKRWLTTLRDLAPDIVAALVRVLANPAANVAGAITSLVRSWQA